MDYAPIAVFIYKRPEITKQTLEALMQCPEFLDSPVYVFCDGIKKSEDKEKIKETRKIVHSLLGTKATIFESEQNKGIYHSIISGVNLLCDKYGKVIVLEDDLVVSPYFLSFLNSALEKYQDDASVMQVSGYMHPISDFSHSDNAFFLPLTTSWGWGTWKRAWEHFDYQAIGWEIVKTNSEIRYKFNINNSFDYFEMLRQEMLGETDSWNWDIRWYWNVFKSNGLVLFPPRTLVRNIGIDKGATHGTFLMKLLFYGTRDFNFSPALSIYLPEKVIVNPKNLEILSSFFSKQQIKNLQNIKKVISKLNIL